MSELSKAAGCSPDKDPRVKMSMTLGFTVKHHEGSKFGGDLKNITVETPIFITMEEASPGQVSEEELYDKVDKLLTAAIELRLKEGEAILEVMSGKETTNGGRG